MMNMQLLNRSGLAAIAAATALVSTPALAQDATTVPSDAAPIVADAPVPAEPATTTEAVSDPLAPATTTTTTTTRTTRTTRPTRATAAPAVRASTPAARTAAPAAAAPAAPMTPVTEALPPVDPAMVAPLPEPEVATPAAPVGDSMIDNDLLPIAGAAGLGILALAGAGFAMRRRRRDDEEEVMLADEWHEPALQRAAPTPTPIRPAPAVAAAPVTASAFSWGSTPGEAAPVNRIESAKRGPTADNPSLSLKKRLKRAAFFDQRDRAIAAGIAAPVSSMAGLPKGLASTAPTPDVKASTPIRGHSTTFGKTFGKTFQPA